MERQMRAAQRATIIDPRVTMWAELAVLAHLNGWDLPRPSPVFTASLRDRIPAAGLRDLPRR
jgi:hypothetical protein